MTVARTAADVLSGHVMLEIESIDRMYLNLYVPPLQRELGVVGFFKHHRGLPFASGAVRKRKILKRRGISTWASCRPAPSE
jgi:hypothetical protein